MASAVRSSPLPPHSTGQGSSNAHKRKRGPTEQDTGRNLKASNPNGDHDHNFAALLQGMDSGLATDDSTRTAQAALATPLTQSTYPEPTPFDNTPGMQSTYDDGSSSGPGNLGSAAQALYEARQSQPQTPSGRPMVGTNEWHQQRKDNHKEVERRRREVINEGIENIAKVVPGTEKNKGAILQRTCQYIGELQQSVASFENERATFDIALKELTSRNDRMKDSARQAWQESAKWQQRCRDAGLHFDDYDAGALGGVDEDDLDPTTGGA